jgi:hypothetical protein
MSQAFQYVKAITPAIIFISQLTAFSVSHAAALAQSVRENAILLSLLDTRSQQIMHYLLPRMAEFLYIPYHESIHFSCTTQKKSN